MRKIRLIKLFVLTALLASGCEDRYRYFCQDPENFDTKECTVNCKGDGTCPSDIIHGEKLDD
jgi:hypothetical protein